LHKTILMSPIAIFLVLISCILPVFRNLLTKRADDKEIFIGWFSAISIVVISPAVFFILYHKGVPDWESLKIPLAAGLIHALYWLSYAKAYHHGDLSHVYPIMRSYPLLVFIFAVLFLDEKTSLAGGAGILLITSGIFVVSLKSFSFKALGEPFRALRKERAVQMAFAALVLSTAYSLIDKVGVTHLDPILYAFVLSLSADFFFFVYLFVTKTKKQLLKPWRTDKKTLLINGVISGINYPLILIALTFSNVSYVTGLRQLSVVFATLAGGLILKEKHQKIRLMGSILILSGAVMITAA